MTHSPRYLLYSHDTYGLGHLRRSIRLAEAITAGDPTAEVLIVTGSPRAQAFALPARVDTVKLPAATKAGDGSYRARDLGIDVADLLQVRSRLVEAAVVGFRPDVVVVDHAPAGLHGELTPILRDPGNRPYRLVLGMRDIIDAAAAVRRQWDENQTWDAVAAYDEVLVYGDASVTTTAMELDLARRVGVPVTHVGYVAPRPAAPPRRAASGAHAVALVGGGGDGHALLEVVLAAWERRMLDRFASLTLVTGPLMAPRRRGRLQRRVTQLGGDRAVRIIDFSPRPQEVLGAADVAISMAGYNTCAEAMAYRLPSLLVPRVRPRREQQVRANRLASRAPFVAVDPEHLTCESVAAGMARLETRRSVRPDVALDGARRAADVLRQSVIPKGARVA